MHYTIHGTVSLEGDLGHQGVGESCLIRIYDPQGLPAELTALAQAAQRPISENSLEALGSLPLAREPLGPDGIFQIDIDDRLHLYHGESFAVVLEVPYLAPMRGVEAAYAPIFVLLGVWHPQWDRSQAGFGSISCLLALSDELWQQCLAHFDLCFVAGTVVDQAAQTPMAEARITLRNGSLEVGQALTDPQGRFAVLYRADAALGELDLQVEAHGRFAHMQIACVAPGVPLRVELPQLGSSGTELGGDQASAKHDSQLPYDLHNGKAWGGDISPHQQPAIFSPGQLPISQSGHAMSAKHTSFGEPFPWSGQSLTPHLHPN